MISLNIFVSLLGFGHGVRFEFLKVAPNSVLLLNCEANGYQLFKHSCFGSRSSGETALKVALIVLPVCKRENSTSLRCALVSDWFQFWHISVRFPTSFRSAFVSGYCEYGLKVGA